MTRTAKKLLPLLLLAALAGCQTQAERQAVPILEKNAAARGGAKAWRAVKTLQLEGKLDAGHPRDQLKLAQAYLSAARQTRVEARRALAHREGASTAAPPVQLPFAMELKRPHKLRVSVLFRGEEALQVWDGEHGYKLRPFLGRREVEPFTAEEARVARAASELDGPLLDARGEGERVELAGKDTVDGRDAWRLRVIARDGTVRHVWVDAETGLDVRADAVRRVEGRDRVVLTSYKDWRSVKGLQVPHLLETTVEGLPGTERILVEKVTVNPEIDDARFARPG